MALVYCQPWQRYGGIRTSIPTIASHQDSLLLVPVMLKREQPRRMSTSSTPQLSDIDDSDYAAGAIHPHQPLNLHTVCCHAHPHIPHPVQVSQSFT